MRRLLTSICCIVSASLAASENPLTLIPPPVRP